jgi:hypothetical protein
MRLPSLVVPLATLLTLHAATERANADTAADSRATRDLSWGVPALELASAGMVAFSFGTRYGGGSVATTVGTVAVLGTGVGATLAAHAWDLDPRGPLMVHGAGWLGLDMFLIGALVDGRDHAWGLRAGRTAYLLGAVGALGGAVLGSQVGAGGGDAWLIGPPVGFFAGAIVLGTGLVFAGGIDGDHAVGQWTTGAVAGASLGIGVATYLVFRHASGGSPTALPQVTPSLDVAAGRTIFSYGGTF